MAAELSTTQPRQLAVVTGASSGIGYELAKQFLEHGFDVVIAAEDEGIHRAQTALTPLGGQVHAVQVDLSEGEGVERLYDSVQALARPVDVLVVNAGIGVWGDFARQTALEDELELIKLNVLSAVHLTKRVAHDMAQRGQGKILFTSSIAAAMPAPLEAVYGASKAFLSSFALGLRQELKGVGVSVTSLMPGPTETNFFHRAGMDQTRVGQKKKDSAEKVAKDGFEALMAGKPSVAAGSMSNKLMASFGKLLSDSMKARMHHYLTTPKHASAHGRH